MHLSTLLSLPLLRLAAASAPSPQQIEHMFIPLRTNWANVTTYMSPNVSFTLWGQPPIGGVFTKSQLTTLLVNLNDRLDNGPLRVELTGVVAQGRGGEWTALRGEAVAGLVGKNGEWSCSWGGQLWCSGLTMDL